MARGGIEGIHGVQQRPLGAGIARSSKRLTAEKPSAPMLKKARPKSQRGSFPEITVLSPDYCMVEQAIEVNGDKAVHLCRKYAGRPFGEVRIPRVILSPRQFPHRDIRNR